MVSRYGRKHKPRLLCVGGMISKTPKGDYGGLRVSSLKAPLQPFVFTGSKASHYSYMISTRYSYMITSMTTLI